MAYLHDRYWGQSNALIFQVLWLVNAAFFLAHFAVASTSRTTPWMLAYSSAIAFSIALGYAAQHAIFTVGLHQFTSLAPLIISLAAVLGIAAFVYYKKRFANSTHVSLHLLVTTLVLANLLYYGLQIRGSEVRSAVIPLEYLRESQCGGPEKLDTEHHHSLKIAFRHTDTF